MECKHNWHFVDGLTKRLRCLRCAEMSFNLDLLDRAEDEEFERIEQQQTIRYRDAFPKDYLMPVHRNHVLEEVALEFEKMVALGDTASSFAAYVRGMKR